MVQITAQDGRAGEDGLTADGANPGDGAPGGSAPGDSTIIAGWAGADGPRSRGGGTRPRPLSPSGSLPPDAPPPLLSLDKPAQAGSAEPARAASPGAARPDVSRETAQPQQETTRQQPAPFNVWAKANPAPLGSAAASPLGSEPAWPAAESGPAPTGESSRTSGAAGAASPGTGSSGSSGWAYGGSGSEGSGHGGSGSGGSGSGQWPDDRPATPGPGSSGPRRRLVALIGVAAAIAVVVAGVGVYLSQRNSPAHAAGSGHQNKPAPAAKGPEHVVSVTPAGGSAGVNGAGPVSVVFSEPLSPDSPMPTLSPARKGTWHVHGKQAEFVPARGFPPRTKVTLKVPAGSAGVRSAGGSLLATAVTARFRTGAYSTVRIEQLLAQLGYLPLTWAPQGGAAPALSDRRAQLSAAYSPPAGTYTWQAGYPAALKRLWKPDAPSQVLRGAVMAFQADHGLTSDMIYENQVGLTLKGSIAHRLWKALFRAAAKDETNKHGYTYALASQHSPETLTVWHDGRKIFRHLANTGIPAAPTAVRTDPVYIRLRTQIMKGRNPDGSKYADPVAWVAYFHGGEAVHYFPRYSYGFQQSLGCVELPWAPAKRIWPYLTYGTLVTVTKT